MNKCALYLLIVYMIMWVLPFVKAQTQGIIIGATGLLVVPMMLTSKPECEKEEHDGGLPRKSEE